MSSVQNTINFPVKKTRSQVKKLQENFKQDKENKASKDGIKNTRLRKGPRTNQENIKGIGDTTEICNSYLPSFKTPAKLLNSPNSRHYLQKDLDSSLLTPETKGKKTDCQPCSAKVCKQLFNQDDLGSSALSSPPKRSKIDTKDVPERPCVKLFKPDISCYQQAKQVLNNSSSSRLVCREKEIAEISSFLDFHLDNKKPGTLYISGAPGTGKTACLTNILAAKKIQAKFHAVFINCMSLKQPSVIFTKLTKELGLNTFSKAQDNLKAVEKFIAKSNTMIVLVLDEIDQLNSKNQEILYTIFDWPRLPKSSLILIGVANALDLTDRVLPRLEVFGCRPKLLHFTPYTKEQVTIILEDRLSQVKTNGMPVIKPVALQLCARKIAACTGDIRKALDVCRRAVELVETEVKQQLVLQTSSDDRCNPGSPRKVLPFRSVELHQINTILHRVFSSRILSSNSLTRESSPIVIPIQQKIFLCTLLLVLKVTKTREIAVGKLYDTYRKVCMKHQIADVSLSEFLSICTMVESHGLVTMKNSKEARLSKISLKIDESEMEYVLQDRTLLASVLSSTSIVKK